MAAEPEPTEVSLPTPQAHDLPLEVLGKIFQRTALDEEGYTIRAQLLALCLVSRAWWKAARLDHQLWGRVAVSKADNKRASYEKAVEYLDRAPAAFRALKTGHDLKVFTCDCLERKASTNVTRQCDGYFRLVSKLLRSGLPLDHLDIGVNTTVCLDRLREVINSTTCVWGTLRSLKVTILGPWIHDPPHFLPLRHLPPLQSLELDLSKAEGWDYPGMPLRFTPIDLPSTTLRGLSNFSLTLIRKSVPYVMHILSECVNLETLTIDFGKNKEIISNIEIVTFPRLHTLTVRNASHLFVARALRFLRGPALANLTIGVRDYPSKAYLPNLPQDFRDFIESLGNLTPLRSLTLCGEGARIARVDSNELISIIAALPNLKHLTLKAIHFDSRKLLDASRREIGFASALESFDLQYPYSTVRLEHILAFVQGLAQDANGHPAGMRRGFKMFTIHHRRSEKALDVVYTTSPIIPELRAAHGVTIERYLS